LTQAGPAIMLRMQERLPGRVRARGGRNQRLAPTCFEEITRAVRLDVERLVKQAERDLENARKNLRVEAYELAAFMCHQAVEKYLKAAWMMHRREAPPRTHSLTELADGLGVPSTLRPKFAYLNPDYTTARYPDAANGVPYEIYDQATAASKIAAAEEVFSWLRQLIATNS
jgi:HEPN domain-containing protein